MGKNIVRILSLVGAGISLVATLVTNLAQEKLIEQTVDERIDEKLAKIEEDEES